MNILSLLMSVVIGVTVVALQFSVQHENLQTKVRSVDADYSKELSDAIFKLLKDHQNLLANDPSLNNDALMVLSVGDLVDNRVLRGTFPQVRRDSQPWQIVIHRTGSGEGAVLEAMAVIHSGYDQRDTESLRASGDYVMGNGYAGRVNDGVFTNASAKEVSLSQFGNAVPTGKNASVLLVPFVVGINEVVAVASTTAAPGRGASGRMICETNQTGACTDYRCWDGSIVANAASCPPSVSCWDGSLAANLAACPVVPTQTCADGSVILVTSTCPAVVVAGGGGGATPTADPVVPAAPSGPSDPSGPTTPTAVKPIGVSADVFLTALYGSVFTGYLEGTKSVDEAGGFFTLNKLNASGAITINADGSISVANTAAVQSVITDMIWDANSTGLNEVRTNPSSGDQMDSITVTGAFLGGYTTTTNAIADNGVVDNVTGSNVGVIQSGDGVSADNLLAQAEAERNLAIASLACFNSSTPGRVADATGRCQYPTGQSQCDIIGKTYNAGICQ